MLASNPRVNVFHRGFKACDSYAGGEEAMAAITCPVLFVLGAQDQMTLPKAAQLLIGIAKDRGKSLEVVSLPVGHHQMTETPDATLFAIRDFLNKHDAGDAPAEGEGNRSRLRPARAAAGLLRQPLSGLRAAARNRAGASACPTARTSSRAMPTSWLCIATRRHSAPTRKWSSRQSTAPARRCWSTTPPAWCSTTRRCTRACAS